LYQGKIGLASAARDLKDPLTVLSFVQDDTNRKAYIGIGFSDRSDSFDLNVALQDHFKQVTDRGRPVHDPASLLAVSVSDKEGGGLQQGDRRLVRGGGPEAEARPRFQGGPNDSGESQRQPRLQERQNCEQVSALASSRRETRCHGRFSSRAVGGLILPPPPGAAAVPGPPRPSITPAEETPSASLLDLDPLSIGGGEPRSLLTPDNGDPWGDFASAPANSKLQSGSWEQF
jgi:hypothetical protein